MTEGLTLVVLRYSPWSERARWALDHHGLRYELVRHEPFVGEPKLRRLVGNRTKRPTVPVLITPEGMLTESWDIVAYADRVGSRTKLVPTEEEAAIRELTDVANGAMASGRALVIRSMLASNDALDEALPPFVPRWLRPALRPFARYGTRWFGRKYDLDLTDTETPRRVLRSALEHFRSRLSGRPYVLGRFSYADIVVCSVLQGIRPPETEHVRLRPGTRHAFTQPELAAEFEDLLAWRDSLYRTERPARVT
jgi:glutathione S-transferase